jgi:hypothetical protein
MSQRAPIISLRCGDLGSAGLGYGDRSRGLWHRLYAATHTERIKFLIAHRPGSVRIVIVQDIIREENHAVVAARLNGNWLIPL